MNLFSDFRAKLGYGLLSGDYSKPPEAGDENIAVRVYYYYYTSRNKVCVVDFIL